MILNGLGVEADNRPGCAPGGSSGGVRPAGGLPASVEEEAALPPGERRLAIDAPTVTQIPSREVTDDSEIVDAELLDQPGEEIR